VLKENARRWLMQKKVLAFVEAAPNDGGTGVVLVLLKCARA
jgi:DNA-nicking Smr family endonuclease